MRSLHEITQNEKLVARGQYRVLRDGQDTGKVEHWNLHRLPDGSHVLRADVDGRDATEPAVGNESLLVHLLLGPDGNTDRLHVRYHDAARKVDAQLTVFPGYATVRRFQDWQALPSPGEIELPENAFVLAPCLSSSAAEAYDEQAGGPQTIEALEVNLEDMLAPTLRAVPLRLEGTEDLPLASVGEFTARHFVEDDAVDVHLDNHNVVLRRVWRVADHDMTGVLSQYTRLDE